MLSLSLLLLLSFFFFFFFFFWGGGCFCFCFCYKVSFHSFLSQLRVRLIQRRCHRHISFHCWIFPKNSLDDIFDDSDAHFYSRHPHILERNGWMAQHIARLVTWVYFPLIMMVFSHNKSNMSDMFHF